MSRILLADDSPHAQRMGERILREEGFEVVTVTDGQTAMLRLSDVDPDVVFADVSLPRKSGYEICREIKTRKRFRHVRVILTAGLLEPFDDADAAASQCDAILKKPFESSMVIQTVRPLIEAAQKDREAARTGEELLPAEDSPQAEDSNEDTPPLRLAWSRDRNLSGNDSGRATERPEAQTADPERVRAAVTLALDASMPEMIDRITEQVLIALGH